MSVIFKTPKEIATSLSEKCKAKRLKLNLTQTTLAKNAGVSYGTLKKFEQTGQVSLLSLLKIAHALGELDAFDKLFESTLQQKYKSLDDMLNEKERKRGRE